ncbi:MAG: glutathione peroxidase [Bacteroidetes bacterium]|nr:glutathione peroxidase [Bacteroidota bacterium]
MKTILLSFFLLFSFFGGDKKSFYDFKAKDLEGNDVDLHKYKGKKILVVNVASECGYTPQYKELEWLYKNYKDSNFVILGFPCNDFGGQEPGTPAEIKSFCSKNYGVTFPLMAKIDVKGKDIAPIYSWLQKKEENGMQDNDVKWNFNKFLIGRNGEWQGYYPSKIKPDDKIITDWIMDR